MLKVVVVSHKSGNPLFLPTIIAYCLILEYLGTNNLQAIVVGQRTIIASSVNVGFFKINLASFGLQ